MPDQRSHFSRFPLELGAEEVHGELSYHKKLVEKVGGELKCRSTDNDFITSEGKIIPFAQFEKENPKEFDFIDTLLDHYYDAEDALC